MTDIVDKIAKLLRLARDRNGTVEGETVLRTAQRLMDEHQIEVDLEEMDEPEIIHAADPLVTVEVGRYHEVQPWRQHVMTFVQMIYRVGATWEPNAESVTLWIFAPMTAKDRLHRAATYYTRLDAAIHAASRHVPRYVAHNGVYIAVDVRHPKPVSMFRRGIADGCISSLFRAVMRAAEERLAEQVVLSDCVEMRKVDKFTCAATDAADPQESTKHEADGADPIDLAIYQHGLRTASSGTPWPLPDMDDVELSYP